VLAGGRCIVNTYNSIAVQVKREFTARYKEAFGKGPENTSVEIIGDVIVIKLQGFLTPLEQAMHRLPDGAGKIEGIRDSVYCYLLSKLGAKLERLTGKSIKKVLKDLNLDEDIEHVFLIMEGVIEEVG